MFPMEHLMPSFRLEMKYRKLADSSIVNYDRTFKLYQEWCGEKGYSFELTPERYESWSIWLGQRRAPSTVNLYLLLMRSFANWAHSEGDYDFKLPVLTVDPGARKPQVLNDDVLSKLLELARNDVKHVALRNELIIRLFLDTGIRRGELLGIRLKHINHQEMSIWVMGKGDKARYVYYGVNTGRAIDRYLRARDRFPHADRTDYLLLGQQGHMTASGIKYLINKFKRQAGLEHLRPHMFRHTFAHDWLDNGGSERDLMRVAGWSSEEMLKVYASERAQERAARSHKRLSRGDRV